MIAVLLIPVLVLLAGQVEAGEPPVTTTECKVYYQHGTPVSTCEWSGKIDVADGSYYCYHRMKKAMTEMQWWLEIEPNLTPYFKAKFRDVSDQVKSDWNATMKECVK